MSGLRDTIKGGWHPKGKDGKSSESWRGDFKGINQVAGWMGKGKDPTTEAKDHVSQPLSALKDPAAFGPPPKNVNYHGGAALPHQTTPDTRGLGAPLSQEQIRAKRQAEEDEARREAEEAAKTKQPSVPYRANTTGLSTSNLPPPPRRKDGADGRSPVPEARSKPSLPPRLPARTSSPASPPPSYRTATTHGADPHKGILNQGSLNRLGAAGISVPGFGIGGTHGKQPLPPPSPSAPPLSSASTSSVNPAQINELQPRFSRLSPNTSPKPEGTSGGTTWAQKQAALKTATSFRNDPSSVSFSDARAAASTGNTFRERHGEQVKSGWQSANKLNTKYGISDRVGAYGAGGGTSSAQSPEHASPQIEMRDNTLVGTEGGAASKKKPPPPPVKKVGLAGTGTPRDPAPPPIPLSSKPKPRVSGS